MADSVWRGSGPFVRWTATCARAPLELTRAPPHLRVPVAARKSSEFVKLPEACVYLHSKSIPSKTRQGVGGGQPGANPIGWPIPIMKLARANQRLTFYCFCCAIRDFAIFARAFFILAARLWQLGAGARVRRHRVVNQGAL
jgi:hypothetical protein